MFAPGTILWCDSQQGIVCIAKAICVTFQGWKPLLGYNDHSLEKGGGKSIPNNNFKPDYCKQFLTNGYTKCIIPHFSLHTISE